MRLPFRCITFLLLILAFTTSKTQAEVAKPVTEEPLRYDEKSRTWVQVLQEQMTWCNQKLVEPYIARNKNNPRLEEELRFIRKALESLVYHPETENSYDAFCDEGKSLCLNNQDPLLALAYALAQNLSHGDCRATIEAALPVAKSLPGPKALAWLLARTETIYKDTAAPERGPDSDMPSLTREVIADESFTGAEYDIFARLFLGDELADYFKWNQTIYEPLVESKCLPEWVCELMRGKIEINKAWELRGGDYENSVSEDGWKGFSQHLKAAGNALSKSYELHPNNPIAATAMITVVMGGEGTDGISERVWFDRATKAQFDYFPAYCHLLWAYRPRWGGSIEKMLEFGKACAATRRMDTVVPEIFFVATSDVVSEEKMDWQEIFRQRTDISQIMVATSKLRVAAPSRQGRRAYNLGMLAANAYLAGDFLTAQAARLEAGDMAPEYISDKLSKFDIRYEVFEEQMKLVSSPGGKEYCEGEELLSKGQTKNALESFQVALAKAPEDLRTVVQEKYDKIKLDFDFKSGEWTRLNLNKDKKFWHFDTSAEQSRTSNKLEVITGYLQFLDYDMGDNFEMRGEFALPDKISAKFVYAFQLVCSGKDAWLPGWIRCRITSTITPGVFAVSLVSAKGAKLVADYIMPLSPKNQFLFHLQNGRFSLKMNDREVASDLTAPDHPYEKENRDLGFAVPPLADAETISWEIRKLPDTEETQPEVKPSPTDAVLKT